MSIKVVIAEPHGYCGNDNFGVQRAVRLAQKTARKQPGKTYLLGEIVHNQHVVSRLEKKYGLKTVQRIKDIPKGSMVIIRAHGVTPSVYQQAEKKGLNIIDATCPLVVQVHKEVKRLAAEGRQILYIASSKNHDEAVGVVGEAPKAVILTTLDELDKIKLKNPQKTIVLTQTTLSVLETQKKLNRFKAKYPEVEIKPHICLATSQRQKSAIELAKRIGFVIIVGHPTSSNSNRLKEVAQTAGAKTYIVDTDKELRPEWFKGIFEVAVSSGASTPEWLLKKVIKKIKNF
ncbi:4-hydroxy-3-methylbut-2-enyl diphosphate reductase [Candidatus Beckwithbacteria bacterium CG10_big_fil_rev_8_21_14_0_10_34_10]|uniref:4-hydroxy-3-methylbut-2-enyl diphosphate reductase n=1 Tax=Candidatus Beckwithbacteria bacterium CG10_big_fil_rev_8_21_14_0_10_34_10 TaxID=1974495 RepID=A0A2H0W976_9BACT|nr:MAG: 4-hydroxy-3-methylbut-2-enyl diphosphate reductase [Candidatus Beckwithbacteria bacterium CG10_big_fil_rev_8_21_14_0_10_34_10]